MADFRFLTASSYAFSLDIARYALGKVRINLLAINTETSAKSNDRFGFIGGIARPFLSVKCRTDKRKVPIRIAAYRDFVQLIILCSCV